MPLPGANRIAAAAAAVALGAAWLVAGGCSSSAPATAVATDAAAQERDASAMGTPRDAAAGAEVLPPDAGVPTDATLPDAVAPDAVALDAGVEGGPAAALAAYVVTGKLTARRPASQPATVPLTHDFTLVLDRTAMTVTIGAEGSAARAPVRAAGADTFEATAALHLAFPVVGDVCNGPRGVEYRTFRFTVGQRGIEGTAGGVVSYQVGGDAFGSEDVTLQILGLRDGAGASLGADRSDVDPLASLILGASEPLAAATRATLMSVPPDGAGKELAPPMGGRPAPSGLVAQFELPIATLKYDATYQVVLAGADLAGNPPATPTRLRTPAAPPLVAEDGFESAGASAGGAEVIEAGGTPPVIAGRRSLFLPPQGWSRAATPARTRATMRLPVAPGDRVVRFSVRLVSMWQSAAGVQATKLRVVALGHGTSEAAHQADVLSPLGAMSPGGEAVYVGAVRTVELPLPAGTGSEVVFDASAPHFPCAQIRGVGYLIDDLRVE